MDITEFLTEQYSDAALYILYRSTASYIDGLKNAARKTIFTIKKANIKDQLKVTGLGSKVTDVAEYLHGESGIQGTIVTMAKDYCGASNLPTIKGIGNFGTRFTPFASAPRYIYAKPATYSDLLFRKEDDVNLTYQEFEGKVVEPVFYVPTLPLILLNGTDGIGVGFKSAILPRSLENMFKLVRATLEGKRVSKDWYKPSWHDFRGTVEFQEDSWVVKGLATFDGKKVHIEELPISWDLKGYNKKLQSLKDAGKIQKFHDFSEDEIFKFDVWLTDEELAKGEEAILRDLGLIEKLSENLTCFDENNAVREYNKVEDIFSDYYKIKIKYMKLRIKSEIARLLKEESDLKEIYDFIQEVIKGTVVLKGKKKAEVEAILKTKGYTIIDKLVSLPLYSITTDKAKEIEKRWKDKIAEREAMEKETPENYWLKDLKELEEALKKEGFIKVQEKETPVKKTTTKAVKIGK